MYWLVLSRQAPNSQLHYGSQDACHKQLVDTVRSHQECKPTQLDSGQCRYEQKQATSTSQHFICQRPHTNHTRKLRIFIPRRKLPRKRTRTILRDSKPYPHIRQRKYRDRYLSRTASHGAVQLHPVARMSTTYPLPCSFVRGSSHARHSRREHTLSASSSSSLTHPESTHNTSVYSYPIDMSLPLAQAWLNVDARANAKVLNVPNMALQ